ncbi:MAG: hypothetical protein WCN95_16065 [bacterium]
MKLLSQVAQAVPGFQSTGCSEIRSLVISQNVHGALRLNAEILHGADDLVSMEFHDVTDVFLRVTAGPIELGEFFIAEEDGGYRIWDELKPLRWSCRAITLTGVRRA